MLHFLDSGFLKAVSAYSDSPHRNPVLRSMRNGKKAIAEALQTELHRAGDAGESFHAGRDTGRLAAPLTAAARLNYSDASKAAPDHDQRLQQVAHVEALRSAHARAVMEHTEQQRDRAGRRRRRDLESVNSIWKPASHTAGAIDLFGTG